MGSFGTLWKGSGHHHKTGDIDFIYPPLYPWDKPHNVGAFHHEYPAMLEAAVPEPALSADPKEMPPGLF